MNEEVKKCPKCEGRMEAGKFLARYSAPKMIKTATSRYLGLER